MRFMAPEKEAYIWCGGNHAEVLGEDQRQEFVPFMAGIFRALNTTDSLHDEGDWWIFVLAKGVVWEAEAEPFHVERREVEIVTLAWIMDDIALEGVGNVQEVKPHLP